jgi:hypothetical protein
MDTMDIDRQRVAAVRALEALGFTYRYLTHPASGPGTWLPPAAVPVQALPLVVAADAMHAALVRRADALAGCTEGSEEEAELRAIAGVLEADEARRWPGGKEPAGRVKRSTLGLPGAATAVTLVVASSISDPQSPSFPCVPGLPPSSKVAVVPLIWP